MNTSRKGGPGSSKPATLSPDDSRLLAFQPGEMSEQTREAIAEHRARYVSMRQQRRGDAAPSSGPVTVRAEDGSVIIRPIPDLRFSGDAPSGLMPLDGSDE